MWYLIVTARSIIWMLISLLATLLMLGAFMSPLWLVRGQQEILFGNETITYTASVGVYTKCSKPIKIEGPACTAIAVRGLATDSNVFPGVWKASTVFLVSGLIIMSATVFMGLVSCRIQSFFKKSIFTMSGAAQALAGICFILGVMLHPMGWGAVRVQKLCGRDASPFYPGDCSLGTGLGLAVAGTLLAFVSACLSVPAENSTSSDKVQDQIYEGQTLICLL
ncbi:LHFPL tetraspan subfamily member 2a protein [Tribolium madens]|uniref:LHFPL tetraspan subfamily member 2a protein n=1 Tax=Tribolium madens TaxID=41895 RepID=UPI001CF75060|nr:LHFPL tetraspan subfamily member 2a protein [Tribolium madens]XP_044265084.1 LHFPL tetraspan subfamily member 2a protein [Tribolium madens]